ncbi:MAG TPA: methyltransferase [Arenimonas sp.]|uniref:class I SAM-dependent methyltransferase n=1 Tax=Arenimonas sp. TaxID=1872635 RepID=UPI002BCF27B3|nr:methyltransferase [Arenimonas sp.]HMB56459.1 methyltransferase [Arenimonas sp.]
MRRSLTLLLSALLLAGCGKHEAPANTATAPAPIDTHAPGYSEAMADPLDRILAGDWRSEENRARDVYRHPRETLAFFGVGRGQKIIEIWPGGGWYSEILAPMQRDNGNYLAVIPDPAKVGDAEAQAATAERNLALRKKFGARGDVYDRASIIEIDPAAPNLGAPGSADVVLTFRNVHNWVMEGHEKAMFAGFFTVLKHGGVLGVVDHRARAGAPAEEMKSSGYLPEDYVIDLAKGAGFELVGKSEINANPNDTKDYPGGVWTLPPTLKEGSKDREKYLAIGESDRMTLKFVKP